ncbi:condensin complex subunit 2/barren [Schizophyllum fasciatum]
MARTTAARRPPPDDENTQPLYDDESDSGSEAQATPRPRKSRGKRRMSEYNPSEGDSSLNDSRAALKESSMQDDAAERRRRRKSTKITVLPDGVDEGPQQAESSRQAKTARPLTSIPAPAAKINVPLDVMSENFEEWMKLATDNKINAGNSWNFQLIDYFHDGQLLRNKDDNSVNFQRASCTLDGCVKIWTSRVDSVGTETSKLATHLAAGGNEDAEEGADSDNPDADPSQPKKKKSKRAENTIGNASKLRADKLELEFSVDPLFKKTCADFDEGGAQGLLMNHLSLGVGQEGALRIIFDASDSVCRVVEEDEHEGDEPEDLIDLTEMRNKFLPDLSVLEDKAISHSLSDFSFTKSDHAIVNQPLSAYMDDDDDDDAGGLNDAGMDVDNGEPQVEEDFFANDEGGDQFEDGPMGGPDYGDDQGNADYGDGEGYSGSGTPGMGPGGEEPFDPTRTDGELFMAMTTEGEKNMFEEFDRRGNANWMGPGAPIKGMSRLARLRLRDTEPSAEAKPKKPREKKEPFKVSFGDRPESMKEINARLFATSKTSINLPKKGKQAKRDEHLLPDDMHFSSRQLITLFLKSRFAIKIRGRKPVINERGDGEVADDYWQQQAAGDGGADDDYDGGDPPPFSTQFMEDDIDEGEQDLAASTLGTARRSRPQTINYARRAKRVDVRKLKDNIWKGLEIPIDPPKDPESMDVDDEEAPLCDGREFGEVIQKLQGQYEPQKLDDISTSFCFICLLHLANEQGLKLEPPAPAQDAGGGAGAQAPKQKVGNLWDVKVFRDPTATQAS